MLKYFKKIINLVFDNLYVFLIFVYFFMILGICTKHYFKLPNFDYGVLILLFIPEIYNRIIYSLETRDLKRIDNDNNLNSKEKQRKKSKIDSKYMTSKFIILIRFFLIIIISFSFGVLIHRNYSISMIQFISTLLYGFFMSAYLVYTFLYEADNRKRAENFFNMKTLLPLLGTILIIFNFIFEDIIKIIANLSKYDYSMFALTFALLCATLSVLSFTYAMALNSTNEQEKETKNNMLKSGEYYFISTIFCLFFLSSLFILSYILNSVDLSSLDNINIFNREYFTIANCCVLMIVSFFITFIYSMKYLLKGIYLSLKNLPFDYDLFNN